VYSMDRLSRWPEATPSVTCLARQAEGSALGGSSADPSRLL
jgi:hypothetical protein